MIDFEALFPPMPSREELLLDTCGCCYTVENPRRRLAVAQCSTHELVADEWRIEAAEEQPALPPAHAGLARSDLYDIERRFGAAPVEMQAPYLVEIAKAGRVVMALLEELTRRDRIDQARRRGSYSTRGMTLQRRYADSVCGDDHCALSGGYGHAGECIPCRCGLEHAIDECPADKVHAPPVDGEWMHGEAQCGWRAGTMRMTFRGPQRQMDPGVNCPGCLAVETKRALDGGAMRKSIVVTSGELTAMARAMFEHPEWVGCGLSWHELSPDVAEGWLAMARAAARGDLGYRGLSGAWWATLFGAAWAAVVDHRKNLDLSAGRSE